MIYEHTKIINKMIGLCAKDIGWPSVLLELGYEVKAMEQNIHTQNGNTAKPDIIILSNGNKHIIVIDCKGGKCIGSKQAKTYDELNMETVREAINARKFVDKYSVAYAINYDNSEIQDQTTHPVIVFHSDHIKTTRTFDLKNLDSALCHEISLEGMTAPTMYYPFGEDDDGDAVTMPIMRGLVALAVDGKLSNDVDDDSTIDAIFPKVHLMHKILPSRHIKLLKRKMREVIRDSIIPDKKFMEHIHNMQK